MVNIVRSFTLLSLIITLSAVGIWAEEDWKLQKNQDEIIVFTRGADDSNIRQARAIVNIKSDDLAAVTKYFLNFENHKKWLFKVESSRVLEKVSDSEYVIYYASEGLWPVAPRDVILRYSINSNEDQITITTEVDPDYLSERQNYVRVWEARSEWIIRRNGSGTNDVEYFNHTNPGGSLPIWLANLAAAKIPFMSLKNLKETIENNN